MQSVFFSNIVKNLDISKYVVGDTLHLNLKNHPILMAILKYRNHWSIITIKRLRYQTVPFHFSHIDKKTVLKIIRSLSNNKASQETDLPVRVVKENAEYFAEIICSQFNESINSSKFPLSFKLANITPVFKNESRNHKNNYRPVSILPLISKVFEKIMNKQLSIYFEGILSKFQCGLNKQLSIHFEQILSKFQCGFRKGFGWWWYPLHTTAHDRCMGLPCPPK